MQKIYIIAEAGINHCGNVDIAHDMIDAAKYCGVDAIKFQTFVTEDLLSENAELITYQKKNVRGMNQFQMLKACEISFRSFKALKAHCDKCGLDFLSTPFDEKSADFIDALVDVYKIASGEITNIPFLEKIAGKGKPVILSTGMATVREVAEAVSSIRGIQKRIKVRHGIFAPLVLLHCTSSYPCKYEEVNMKAMLTLRRRFRLPVGYSDHTQGIEVAVAAAALGAEVIEKHFTLDKNMDGPDQNASLTPAELGAMVASVRNVEKAMGTGVKTPTEDEKKTLKGARKSIVASRDLPEGHVLTRGDICIKRPGTGLTPAMFERLIGRRLARPASKNIPLLISDLRPER